MGKATKSIRAYTDYPLYGDKSQAVKEVQVLTYDRNKYALVLHKNTEEVIKAGYLFKDPHMSKRLTLAMLLALPRTTAEAAPTRHQTRNAIKRHRRFSKTEYAVKAEKLRTYANLRDALVAFKSSPVGTLLSVTRQDKLGSLYQPLLQKSPEHIDIFLYQGKPSLKTGHLLKHVY